MNITENQYIEALKIIKAYEKQIKENKLKKYKGLTRYNIVSNECKFMYYDAVAFWVVEDGKIPNRDYDGLIINKETFYTIEGCRTVYENFIDAYLGLIKIFKRKKLISTDKIK